MAYRHRIDVFYNVKRRDGIMPEFEFVKDISYGRHLGGGDYKSKLRTEDDVDMAVRLLKLIWKNGRLSSLWAAVSKAYSDPSGLESRP